MLNSADKCPVLSLLQYCYFLSSSDSSDSFRLFSHIFSDFLPPVYVTDLTLAVILFVRWNSASISLKEQPGTSRQLRPNLDSEDPLETNKACMNMINLFASKDASCFRPNLPLCYRHVPSFALLISMQQDGEEVNLNLQ